jgi:PilZ domain
MDTSYPTVTSHLSQEAQRQLDAVRAALDVRLSALEAVLADPTRGESLEGLILDLARVAAEEAQAAAAKACVDADASADTRVAHARGAAQEAIEQERAVTADLRRALDQAQQRFASLEQEHLIQLRRMREEVDAELSGARTTADAVKDAAARGAADARRELDAARKAAAQLQQQLDAAAAQSNNLAEEHAVALLLEQEWTTQLAAEREIAAGLGRELSEAQSRLQSNHAAWQSELAAARASLTALQRESDTSADRLTVVARDCAATRAAHDEITTQLADERGATARLEQSLAGAERSLADAVAQLDAERACTADLRRGVEQAQQDLTAARAGSAAKTDAERSDLDRMNRALAAALADLATLGAERDVVAAELRSARELIEFQNEALATVKVSPARLPDLDALEPELDALETVRPPELDATVTPTEAPRKKRAAKPPIIPPALTTEEGWGPVRLANRYAFREPIPVQINGDAALLFDLSVTGCQFVTPVAVRPNQVVKVVLPTENAAIPCTGKVMWARFEACGAGRPLGYRAGVQFTKPDHSAIEAFLAARTASA